MKGKNKFIKNIILHIRYPYTAFVIAVMWICMAIIISRQESHIDILVMATSICTLLVAWIGFRSPK